MRGRWTKAMQFVFVCFSVSFRVFGFFFGCCVFFWQTTTFAPLTVVSTSVFQLVIAVFALIQASCCVLLIPLVLFFSQKTIYLHSLDVHTYFMCIWFSFLSVFVIVHFVECEELTEQFSDRGGFSMNSSSRISLSLSFCFAQFTECMYIVSTENTST